MAIETPLTVVRNAGTAGDGQSQPPPSAPDEASAARPTLAGVVPLAASIGRPDRENRQGTVDQRELDDAVTRIQDFVQTVRRELQFQVDRQSGETIVRVVDRETNEVIRQIPPEEIVEVSRRLRALTDGVLLQERA
ncbi:MAG TPA: flagellar protein FlaG [Chromatiales bacterium]|nr:flagellar protein FlaG [Chromatiales bacterium]